MAEPAAFKIKIPENVTRYLKPDAPREARLMAARGLVPMPPPLLATALTFFLGETDEELRTAARSSLLGMPPAVVQKVVREEIHPKALDFFGREYPHRDDILEGILLNRLTPDDTFVHLAVHVSERLATLVGNNQVRLLRSPSIAEALRKNPNALKSEVDRVVSFLKINGILLEGESPELTKAEIQEILSAPEPEELPPIPQELIVEEEGEPAAVEAAVDDDDEEEEALPEKDADSRRESLTNRLASMTVGQKIKLALLGNKEARGLLIKDSNKIVATTVVKSGRMTDGEIVACAQMRNVHDDVVRMICQNPEWTRNYQIQVALANNPKTPFPHALKFMRQLHTGDLQKLVKNKNVSSQLAKLAKELYTQKKEAAAGGGAKSG